MGGREEGAIGGLFFRRTKKSLREGKSVAATQASEGNAMPIKRNETCKEKTFVERCRKAFKGLEHTIWKRKEGHFLWFW